MGVNQRQIAKAVGQDPAAISRLESGLTGNSAAGLNLKKAVAKVLGLPAEVVFPELKSKE